MAEQFERRDRMFPRLDDSQIELVEPYGERRRVAQGELVFDLGTQDTPFFVVLSGCLEISQPNDGDGERAIVRHDRPLAEDGS